ncbi:hypothetical protein [Mucilaginibacter sp.]|uniref:hypothetical protein n=1 Tax=Mucilaginibacter sp. TaxID=1882438 RepID=UPI003D143DC7
MTVSTQTDPVLLQACLLAGSFADLSKLDFSAVNLVCYNLKRPAALKKRSAKYPPVHEDYYALYNMILKDAEKMIDKPEYIHVLLPKDFSRPLEDGAFYRCVEVLRLLFPSDLDIHTVADFDLDVSAGTIEWAGSAHYHFYTSGKDRYDHYLYFQKDPKQISLINDFIRLYFQKIGELKYLRVAIDAYSNSFSPVPLHMSFISLGMALETVVDGTSELSYRIRRTVALICADNAHVAGIIFQNINKIYKLRSTIVHGDAYKYQLVREYHPYLRSLISRTIVQLLHTDFKTATELQEAILFAGFSDRGKLFTDETISLNILSYAETLSSL